MSALLLFGLDLAPLFGAIAQVESERGSTSPNVYQIKNIYVADVNRIANRWYRYGDQLNPVKAEQMMLIYWKHYGGEYECLTGKRVTYEVLAKIHNRGPYGWRVPEAEPYWQKVKAVMEKEVKK